MMGENPAKLLGLGRLLGGREIVVRKEMGLWGNQGCACSFLYTEKEDKIAKLAIFRTVLCTFASYAVCFLTSF